MNELIRVGIISYAHLHAPRYAAAFSTNPQVKIVGISGIGVNANVAQAEAKRYGVAYYKNIEGLLSQKKLDAVYIGTKPTRHRDVICWAAAHGLHVLCDKPIATTLEDADEIVSQARSAGIKLMVPFNPRFQLPFINVKQALVNGKAGSLVAIYAVKYGRLPTKATGPQNADWFLDPSQSGGGGFLDIGIHAVDALRWLARAEAKRVYASIGTMIHKGLPCDDLGTMTIEFENGVVAVLSAGWANPDGYPAWLDVRFEILTTKQAFLIKGPYHDFEVFTHTGAERHYWWRRDIDCIVNDFIQAILQDRDTAITGEDARAALAIVQAAYKSARQGTVIEIG